MPTIGSVELLIVILVAFLVVGPRDLPRLMRNVGKWVHRIRMMATEFQHNLDAVVKEADLEDLKEEVVSIRREADDLKRSISEPVTPTERDKAQKRGERTPAEKTAGEGAKE